MSKPIVLNSTEVVKLYQNGSSASEIAKTFGTSTHVITRTLKIASVPQRSQSDSAKIRLAKYGHPSLGRTHSQETREKMRANHADVSGENNPNYKHGLRTGGSK